MKKTWILVADSSRARFFSATSAQSTFNEITDLCNAEGRLHEREITTDLPGRGAGKDAGSKHAYENEVSPKQQETQAFARDIARYLEDAHAANKFDQLILLAAPTFLGLLRKQLSDQVLKKIFFELDKNLVTHGIDAIRKHLPEYFPSL